MQAKINCQLLTFYFPRSNFRWACQAGNISKLPKQYVWRRFSTLIPQTAFDQCQASQCGGMDSVFYYRQCTKTHFSNRILISESLSLRSQQLSFSRDLCLCCHSISLYPQRAEKSAERRQFQKFLFCCQVSRSIQYEIVRCTYHVLQRVQSVFKML
ncbi:Hypothetical_protein [Hexamita inflata]|uniref:Hypothetical_protein n=1 Tax=Hexamita inflata TaxID=28002 RepID=A0AA86TGJ9_9EUKA|nr:Hypothetical protein HINF_LOCUS5609 [Hexamita inflata]